MSDPVVTELLQISSVRGTPTSVVVAAGLSAMAKKLRGELILRILEDFMAGRSTARVMLVEFRRAESALAPHRDQPTSADEDLRAFVETSDESAGSTEPMTETARRYLTTGTAEWERLRQVGRDRDRPVPEWEIFAALHKLAPTGGRTPVGFALEPQHIEEAMDLDGLGPGWSIHQYLRDLRGKFGPRFRPPAPELTARLILRVDAARQLLRPGGFSAGISAAPTSTRTIGAETMYAFGATVQQVLSDRINATYALGLLRNGPTTSGVATVSATELRAATRAGAAIGRARRARARADQAVARADRLRERRLASTSTAFYAAAMTAGLGLILIGVLSGAQFQLSTIVGICIAVFSVIANVVKDWVPNSKTLVAPIRLWVTARAARTATRIESYRVDRLYRPARGLWHRAGATALAAGLGVFEAVSRPLDRLAGAPEPDAPSSGPRHARL